MIHRLANAVAAVLALAASGALADQRDPRLPDLFDDLRTATGYLEGRVIEQKIWDIWMTSPESDVSRLMAGGVSAMQASDFATALAAFSRAIELAPDFAEAWNKRATVLYLIGDYEGSLADVERTLALEPRHFGALSGLGLINAALERDEAALAAFERALAINPHMPGVVDNLRLIRERLRQNSI